MKRITRPALSGLRRAHEATLGKLVGKLVGESKAMPKEPVFQVSVGMAVVAQVLPIPFFGLVGAQGSLDFYATREILDAAKQTRRQDGRWAALKHVWKSVREGTRDRSVNLTTAWFEAGQSAVRDETAALPIKLTPIKIKASKRDGKASSGAVAIGHPALLQVELGTLDGRPRVGVSGSLLVGHAAAALGTMAALASGGDLSVMAAAQTIWQTLAMTVPVDAGPTFQAMLYLKKKGPITRLAEQAAIKAAKSDSGLALGLLKTSLGTLFNKYVQHKVKQAEWEMQKYQGIRKPLVSLAPNSTDP